MTCERIEINPDIMAGKPVIRGTRVSVELILHKLGAGMPPEVVLTDHPRLTHEDILAAQAFAAGKMIGFAKNSTHPTRWVRGKRSNEEFSSCQPRRC
jgi:uncharacterized protein (DUF433 family)